MSVGSLRRCDAERSRGCKIEVVDGVGGDRLEVDVEEERLLRGMGRSVIFSQHRWVLSHKDGRRWSEEVRYGDRFWEKVV